MWTVSCCIFSGRQGRVLIYCNPVAEELRIPGRFSFFHNIPSLFCRILFLSLIILLQGIPCRAATKVVVQVTGIGEPLYKNVLARLTINLQKDNERLQPRTINRLHRKATEDIRSALAPYGYYNPVINASLKREGRPLR